MNGWPIACGLALAFYIVGLSYVAKRESFRGNHSALAADFSGRASAARARNEYGRLLATRGLVFVDLDSVDQLLRANIFMGGEINIGWIVTNLLAGIVLVDWLAVVPQLSHWTGAVIFLALFGLTKLSQQFVPAT